jgi:hypothetical protein
MIIFCNTFVVLLVDKNPAEILLSVTFSVLDRFVFFKKTEAFRAVHLRFYVER